MHTIDRQFHEWPTKDMAEVTQPWFDKHADPDAATKALQSLWTRIGDHCWHLGLMGDETAPVFALGRRLMQLGDDLDTAVRKAGELADEISQFRRAAA